MNRHLGHILNDQFPSVAAIVVPNWKRVFQGGIDALRPSQDMKELTKGLHELAKVVDRGGIEKGFAPFANILQRALVSDRARQRIRRWLRRQPVAMLNVYATPCLAYLRLVEARLPRAALGLTPANPDLTRAAVVQRQFRDARDVDGEARWSLIKTLAPDALTRYEQTVECLVRAESTRRATPILEGNRPTFGKLVGALATHPPPILSCMLDRHAHKVRNAFSHRAGARYDAETGQVRLRDDHWSWQGSVDELLGRFEAMNRVSNQFENATIAVFLENLMDLIYDQLDLLLIANEQGRFIQAVSGGITQGITRTRTQLKENSGVE